MKSSRPKIENSLLPLKFEKSSFEKGMESIQKILPKTLGFAWKSTHFVLCLGEKRFVLYMHVQCFRPEDQSSEMEEVGVCDGFDEEPIE